MLAGASIRLRYHIPEILNSPPNIMFFVKEYTLQRRGVIPSAARNIIQRLEPLAIILQIPAEKRPVHTLSVIQFLISSRHHIVVGRFPHRLQHLVCRVQYHLPVAPGNSGNQKRHYLDVSQIAVSVRELHRIVLDKRLGVVFQNKSVKIFFYFKIFHAFSIKNVETPYYDVSTINCRLSTVNLLNNDLNCLVTCVHEVNTWFEVDFELSNIVVSLN